MARRNYRRGRDVEYLARDLLRSLGYCVVRSAGSHSPVDLIAWSSTKVLLVQAKRTRAPIPGIHAVVTVFAEDLQYLRRIPRPDHGAVQLWLYADRQGWRFFDVLPGGIVEVSGHA